MPAPAKQVYVVSDIHIGGVYPPKGDTGDRGFRIATHIPRFTAYLKALAEKPVGDVEIELVINGDFIDFLAETDHGPDTWVPFTPDPTHAVQKLEAIVERDKPVFDALGVFLKNGHRLTILLGNHDIELALPAVRQRFMEFLGVEDTRRFSFIYDGEAYVIGDVLIEHGNRYDMFNMVNHDLLRRVRSLQSRHQEVPPEYAFPPPPGSNIVASIMNPIKVDYPFIDLLKPEAQAAIPVLLALDPGVKEKLAKFAAIALDARKHKLVADAMPGIGGDIGSEDSVEYFGGDISAGDDWEQQPAGGDADLSDPIAEVLRDYLGQESEEFLQELDTVESGDLESIGSDISAAEALVEGVSLIRLFLSGKNADVEKRLPVLLKALRILRKDESFNRSLETATEYLDAANELARGGFQCIVFGHTHLPKFVELDGGARYINTGTWADFMKFPEEIISGSKELALPKLREFLEDLKERRINEWVSFAPTYARLDMDGDDRLIDAQLCDYDESAVIQ